MNLPYRLLIILLLLGAISQKAASELYPKIFSTAEINTLDYPFMKDIAKFIRQTDQDKLFTQYDKPQFEPEYCFDIDYKYYSKEDKSFYVNGTYSITVSLASCIEQYFFVVDGIRFHTYYALVPYFDSCRIKRVNINTDELKNEEAFWYYFWFFEVKDGKVIDAVYFYEPVDDGFDKYDVYDLINKKYIPYKEWKSRIHSTK